MRQLMLVVVIMLSVANVGLAAQSPDADEPTVAVAVTPTQLGWMAYGAPVQTFEAMGCPELARDVEEGFRRAETVSVVGNVLGLASAAAIGTNALDLEVRIGPLVVNAQVGATLVSVALSGVSQYLKWRTRQDARSRAMEIARLHLDGEGTCFQSASLTLQSAAR